MKKREKTMGMEKAAAPAVEGGSSAHLRGVGTGWSWSGSGAPASGTAGLERAERGRFAAGLNFYKLSLVCVVGSFAGVAIEMLWCLLHYGSLESRRGLLYGPFNLLYGVGAVLLTAALYRYRGRGLLRPFLVGMIVCSALEYVCSWVQEALLGSRSWDYSGIPLNINGRICLLYSVFWGILGVLWIRAVYPWLARQLLKLPDRLGRILTWALVIFLTVNAAVSCVAVGRWSRRMEGEPAGSAFWEWVDERFPDQRMERVFANMMF